jgi:hypothetical protein
LFTLHFSKKCLIAGDGQRVGSWVRTPPGIKVLGINANVMLLIAPC